MPERRDSFILYRSFYEAINDLPDENQLQLYKAIFEYSLNFQEPKFSGINNTVWKLIVPQLAANNKKYLNGKQPKKKQKTSTSEANIKQDVSKHDGNVNDNENDNVNVNGFWSKKYYQWSDYLLNPALKESQIKKYALTEEVFKKLYEDFETKNVVAGLSMDKPDFEDKVQYFHRWIPGNMPKDLGETPEQKLRRKQQEAKKFF